MPQNREAPAPQSRQAEGDTGATSSEASVTPPKRRRTRQERHEAALDALFGAYRFDRALGRFVERESQTPPSAGRSPELAATVRDGCALDLGPEVEASPVLRPAEGGRAHTPTPPPADHSAEHPNGTGAAPLPCRSLGTSQPRVGVASGLKAPPGLNSAHKKTAAALSMNVAALGAKFGANRLGFLTLTFADHVTCPKEASRRFNSLATHVLKPRYLEYIRVMERQKSGRIHYHLLVVLNDDIRTGVDFGAFAKGDYKSAPQPLRVEWAFWRKTAPLYRFGRTELMPVKSNADALAQYVGKYIGKHVNQRTEKDKGARLVSYTSGARIATSRFTPIGSKHAASWRGKVRTFAWQVEAWQRSTNPAARIETIQDLKMFLGPNWAFHWRDYIFQLPPADLSVPF